MPHRVHGISGGDHAALHVLVGVGPRLALAQVETGRRIATGVRLLLVHHAARIDAEKQRPDKDEQPEAPTPERHPHAAARRRRGAGVDLHALVESHRMLLTLRGRGGALSTKLRSTRSRGNMALT